MAKKSTKKALAMSALSLVLSSSMFVGTTFAWFTDEVESGVNQIVSGNLDVELSHQGAGMSAFKDVNAATDLFRNVNGDKVLWEPGVKVSETFLVSNEGSLAFNYNFEIAFTNATWTKTGKTLADALTATVVTPDNEVHTSPLKDFSYKGYLLAKTSEEIDVTIEWIPSDNDNEFNVEGGMKIDFGVKVIATQRTYEKDGEDENYDQDAFYCDVLATPETIDEVLAQAEEGMVIGLAKGTYGNIMLTQKNLTLTSNGGAVVAQVNMNAMDGAVLDNLTFDAAKAGTVYRYVRPNIVAADYVANVTNTVTPHGVDNAVIKNCTFTGTPVDASKYCPIDFEDQDRTSGPSENVTVTGCTFECNALNYVRLSYVEGNMLIENNVFGGANYSTVHHNINATSNGGNWTITGNNFNNWADGEYAFGTSSDNTPAETKVMKIENNYFNTEVAAGAETIALSFKNYAEEELVAVVKNNVANEGLAEFSELRVEQSGKYRRYYMSGVSAGKVVAEGVVQDANNEDKHYLTREEGLKNLDEVLKVAAPNEANVQTIELLADIDWQGADWKPLQYMFVTFNGNGHTISNLNCVKAEGVGHSGFWGYAGAVKFNDLTLENVTACGTQAGIFAGGMEGATLTNCFLKGTNSVTFEQNPEGQYQEAAGGIGVVAGVTVVSDFSGLTILAGTTVTLTNNGLNSVLEKHDNFGGYKVPGYSVYTGTVTNYGTIIMGVTTADELIALTGLNGNRPVTHYANRSFKLMKDIDFEGKEMAPIGTTYDGKLVFDGNGHTISNVKLVADSYFNSLYSMGFFYVTTGSTLEVYDLTIENVVGETTEDCYAAVVAGYVDGGSTVVLENVNVVNASIKSTGNAAMFIGYATSSVTMTNCTISDACTAQGEKAEKTGGFVGTANTASCTFTLVGCVNNSSLTDYGRVIYGAIWNA